MNLIKGTKDFPLFSPNSAFPDNRMMTLADAFLMFPANGPKGIIRQRLIRSMEHFECKFPCAGFGGMLRR